MEKLPETLIFLPLLLGLGLNHLSCAPPLLKELKFFGRRFTQEECEALVDEILSMARPVQIKERLKRFTIIGSPIYWPEGRFYSS